MIATVIDTHEDILKIFRPTHDRLMVLRDRETADIQEIEEDNRKIKITRRGLQIPDTAKLVINTGKVLRAGVRCNQVKDGMHVVFGKSAGTELTINGATFLVMRKTDLLFCTDPLFPFDDRVLIEMDETPKIIKGIHVPDTVQDSPQTGQVLASNTEAILVGSRVLFGKFAGTRIMFNGREILVIREQDIFAEL